jgi:hypothetical protein
LVLGCDGYEEETSVIADLDDLKEVLSITQNFEGIPKYKIDFFNNVFYPCYKAKNDIPDSSKDGTKQEDRVAVTARQLCDAFKKVRGKSITTDNLKKTYLDELMSNGLIDYDKSNIDAKQYIYFPIADPLSSIIAADEQDESLSLLSNSDQFDKVSQYSSTIYEKIIKNVTETWLFSEFIRLLQYRIDTNSIQGPLADFLNNSEEFKILDNNFQERESSTMTPSSITKTIPTIDDKVIKAETNENSECCWCYDSNDDKMIDINDRSNKLTIRQFTKKFTTVYSSYRFDNKRSPNIAPFGEISPIKSNLAKFDNKDINTTTTTSIENEHASNTISKEQSSSLLIPCNHCSYQGKSENEVLKHAVNAHPEKIARPDPSLLELLQQQQQKEIDDDINNINTKF